MSEHSSMGAAPEGPTAHVPAPRAPQRVFVTGAQGFVGSALVEAYRGMGVDVRGVDLTADPHDGIVAGDISRVGDWQQVVAGCDLVVHTAAVVSNVASREACWRTNVLGTRLVLDAAVLGGARRLVHFSSVDAYSIVDFPDDVTESYPLRPDGDGFHYGESKVAGEAVVWQAHAAGEIACTVVRPTDIYGPKARANIVLPLQYVKSGQFFLPATGYWSPVYIDDLVEGVVRAGGIEAGTGQAFNIGGGFKMLTRDFFERLCQWAHKKPVVLRKRTLLRLSTLIYRATKLLGRSTEICPASIHMIAKPGGYSIAKARRLLGYEPRTSLDEGMRRTEEWLRANGYLD
jgi:nucleoside-diphosphate-sugar epimerase